MRHVPQICYQFQVCVRLHSNGSRKQTLFVEKRNEVNMTKNISAGRKCRRCQHIVIENGNSLAEVYEYDEKEEEAIFKIE